MANEKQVASQANSTLLTADEQDVCRKIVVQDTDLAGQRAATLLAINEGLTQAQASEQTGLTVSQIRYLMTAFRKKRLAIFPDDILSQPQSPAKVDEVQLSAEAEGVVPVKAEAKVEKKSKKAKKDKKHKKDKAVKTKKTKSKDKKKKKGKKGKKSNKKKSKK